MTGVFQTETVSSISDLVTKLDTFMSGNGWVSEHLDVTATAGTGGEWAMRLIAAGVEVRFAASWDAANSGTKLALYHYTDQNYVVGDRPWGQDHDSGNGGGGTLDATIAASRHVDIGSSPVRYYAFLENDSHVYIIVEVATGEFVHFGFGMGDKNGGDWTGGSFVYGQRNSASVGASQAIRDGRTHLLDGLFNDTSDAGDLSNNSELFAATVHIEGFANQPAGGKFGVCMGGKESSPQVDFGQDRQSNDGVSSDVDRVLLTWGYRSGPWANGFYRASNTDLSGELRFWPICTSYVDTTTGDVHGLPTLKMKDVFGCNMRNYVAGDVITDDAGDTYYVFPAHKKYSGSGAETGTSGYLGIAYKVPEAAGALAPDSFAQLSAWWDFDDAAEVTLEDNGRISTVADKSGNALDLTQTTDANRPRRVDIDGMSYGQFQSADTHYMSAAHDDLLDVDDSTYTMFVVLRQDSKSAGSLLAKGNTADPRFQVRTYLTSGDSDSDGDLIVTSNDDVGSGDVFTNDTSEDWTGGDVQLITVQIDKNSDIYRIYRNGSVTSDSGDSISTVGTLSSTGDLYVGVQQASTFSHPLDGQIGEIVIMKGNFSTASINSVNQWLIDKWSIGTDSYVDPGLPSSVGTPTGWYSVRDSGDYSISAGAITQLNDKSGNGNHLTPASTGPGLRRVRGLDWMNFESSTPTELSGSNTSIDPGTGDFTVVCVFRSSATTKQGLFYKEDDGDERFGAWIANSNSRSLLYEMEDATPSILSLEHDDADNDYTDGSPKVMAFTYDDSADDARLFGTRGPLAQVDAQDDVAENLTYVSGAITPAATLRIGEGATADNQHLDGQIAEILFFSTPLSDAARADLYEYLFEKWNLTEYYYDPGLPSVLPTVSARWDAFTEDDLTLSTQEITAWDDKTGGGADWSVPGGKTGPAHRWIRGRKWAHFEAGSNWVMTQASIAAIEPGSQDWEAIVVYKAEDHGAGNSGAMFGCKNTTGGSGASNTNYGIFIINSNGSLYSQIGENGSVTQIVNDTSVAYDDLDARIARVFMDYSTDDLYLHGNDPTDIATVSASDTAGIIPDITPNDDAALGDWSTDYDRQFRGQIAEIIIFKNAELSAAQETALQTYLSEKWGVEI